MYIILVYDINVETKEGQRVLNKIFKICKRFLHHIQNSVFEGNLSLADFSKLEVEINNLIRSDIDSVIFFSSREERWLEKRISGVNKNDCSNIL